MARWSAEMAASRSQLLWPWLFGNLLAACHHRAAIVRGIELKLTDVAARGASQ